jgi:hypothetical protein
MPPTRKKLMKRKPELQSTCIAYLAGRRCILYVSKRYRAEIAKRWKVERPASDSWYIARRGYSILVFEVRGFIGPNLMSDEEGDERIRKRYKCGKNHNPEHKKCSPDSLTSYDYMGFSECERGETGDSCDEIYVKIGEFHEWNYDCSRAWADLPVYRWVCLP